MKIPLTTYRIHLGDYPSTAEGLQALVNPPSGKADRWKGPYLQDGKLPKDPWGRDYQYKYPGTHNKTSYDLYSLGASGQDDDKVIGNW
jgi:general secretion pathway protein G